MFRPFTGHNPAGAKSPNGVLLGFSLLFRKFCAAEQYTEVAKMLEEFILTLMEGQNDSLDVILRRALGTFP